jgi:hypothetical protein
MPNKKPKEITVFLDGVDWQHEIGEAVGGNKVYPSIEDLKEYNRCWNGCGIVKCKLVFEEWVVEQNFEEMFKDSSKSYTLEDLKTNRDIMKLESAQKRAEWLLSQLELQNNKITALKNKIEKEKNNVTK